MTPQTIRAAYRAAWQAQDAKARGAETTARLILRRYILTTDGSMLAKRVALGRAMAKLTKKGSE